MAFKYHSMRRHGVKCSAGIFWAPVEARADAQMGHLHLVPVASAHLRTGDYAHAALDGARVAAGISDLQQLHDQPGRPPRSCCRARPLRRCPPRPASSRQPSTTASDKPISTSQESFRAENLSLQTLRLAACAVLTRRSCARGPPADIGGGDLWDGVRPRN